VNLAKTTLIGVCLMTFSGGIVTTVAIDRYWPRGRPECGGVAPASAAALVPAQGFEATPQLPVSAAVAEVPPPAPPAAPAAPAAPEPAPTVVAPANPALAAKPAPAAKPALAAKPAPVVKPAPAAKPAAPAAKPATQAPAARAVASAPGTSHAAPAQARASARKRPAGKTAVSAADKATSPTETWTDPFAPQ
jgi:outer membrane biosynthesis protein TonB